MQSCKHHMGAGVEGIERICILDAGFILGRR